MRRMRREAGDNMMLNRGDRVELLAMPSDPDPIPVGSRGTVVAIFDQMTGGERWQQVDVAWDNGRTLMLVIPPDRVRVLKSPG